MHIIKNISQTSQVKEINEMVVDNRNIHGFAFPEIRFESGTLNINPELIAYYDNIEPTEKLILLRMGKPFSKEESDRDVNLIDLFHLAEDKFPNLLLSCPDSAVFKTMDTFIEANELYLSLVPELYSSEMNTFKFYYFKGQVQDYVKIMDYMKSSKRAIVDWTPNVKGYGANFNRLCGQSTRADIDDRLWISTGSPKIVMERILTRKLGTIEQ